MKWIGIIIAFVIVGFIIENCTSSGNSNSSQEYIKAVNEADYDKAHDILDNLYANYLTHPDSERSAQRYWTAANYIYKAEMQWLLPQHDMEIDKRFIYMLDAMNPIGLEPTPNYRYGLTEHNQKFDKFNAYCSFTDEYNKLCLELIKISLRNDNEGLARQTLGVMKTCYHKINEDDTYIYEPDNKDRDKAESMINNYTKEN